MADPNSLRDAARRGAFGHFSDDESLSPWQVGQKIIERMQIPPGSDRLRIQNWVRQARRQWDEAQEFRNSGDNTTPWVPRVPDPSLEGEIASYRYRVLVELTDPDTGDRYATVVLVDSTGPLSLDQIRDDALSSWLSIRGPDRHYLDRNSIGEMPDGNVTVLSGGMRVS